MIKYILIPFIALGLLTACSESELITPGDEYLPGNQTEGAYFVDIDGVTWDFSSTTQAINNNSGSQINGNSQSGGLISISLPQQLTVGTFNQNDGALISINTGSGIFTNMNETGLLPFTVNITGVDSVNGKVTGTFSGTVYNMASGVTEVLTNGLFVKIRFEVTPAQSTVFKAKFDGEVFDFSVDARAEGIQTAALISGKSPSQNNVLSITIPNGISVGTFNQENGVVIKVNMGSSPADVYSNYDAATDTFLPGSITINSITDGETGMVTGSFKGTIAKFTNGNPSGQIQVTSGQIKVPVVIP